MEYNNLRNKIGKFYSGGKILIAKNGLAVLPGIPGLFPGQEMTGYTWTGATWVPSSSYNTVHSNSTTQVGDLEDIEEENYDNGFDEDEYTVNGAADKSKEEDGIRIDKNINRQKAKDAFMGVGKQLSGVDFDNLPDGMSEGAAMGTGIAAKAGVAAVNAIDQATMGDKNFGAGSQAIDSAVHGVSGALMSSGNPYAMIAGAALEGVNFLTKAGGQTVQGYDVNIENSGFGNLGHQESSSSRSFLFGLGDITGKKMQAKLARRNEQARMALKAAEISEDVKFEQEARMNSVDNVLRNNQIALAGGIDTSLLGS